MTVSTLLATSTSEELTEWMNYIALVPDPDWKADLRAAHLIASIKNLLRKPSDYTTIEKEMALYTGSEEPVRPSKEVVKTKMRQYISMHNKYVEYRERKSDHIPRVARRRQRRK